MLEESLNRSIMNSDSKTTTEINNDRNERTKQGSSGSAEPKMSMDETIGFHKGSINTLISERNELLKMVSVVEQLVNAHAAELSKLGVSMMPPANNDPNQEQRE